MVPLRAGEGCEAQPHAARFTKRPIVLETASVLMGPSIMALLGKESWWDIFSVLQTVTNHDRDRGAPQ